MMFGHVMMVASLLLQSSSAAAPSPQPVAIVSAIKGSAWIVPKTGARQALTLYDWIKEDAVVDVAAQARLEVILIDGRRYALGGGARARLAPSSLTTLRGSVTEESAMPRLVSLAPIAGESPSATGAVRLRGRTISRLNPCEAIVTLRNETILRFDPVEGASQYDVEVRSTNDEPVFARTVDQSPLAIPAGVLAAGTGYVWTVRTVGVIPPAKSEARFMTLDSGAEAARGAFVSSLDPATSGLLGGIDFHLGLLNEALSELAAAEQRTPADRTAAQATERARLTLATACK
jgi:hypothetical protein